MNPIDDILAVYNTDSATAVEKAIQAKHSVIEAYAKMLGSPKFNKTRVDRLNDMIMEECLLQVSMRHAWIPYFLYEKYGALTLKECEDVMKTKRLALAYDTQNNLLGVIANNRWLYTADGKIIGKTKNRFNLDLMEQ